MFSELGDTLPLALELARHDEEVAALVEDTYHGRRHRSMEKLARRITRDGLRAEAPSVANSDRDDRWHRC
jgi:hypothetical protein